MYALVNIAGQQFRVEKDQTIKTQKLDGAVGESVSFDQVLLVADGADVRIGAPVLPGAAVQGKIVNQTRDDKIIVFKKKRRKGYRRTNGHRQQRTAVKIEAITL
ncbi:MAG: 50S ribosomal protein L21 [bacterium]